MDKKVIGITGGIGCGKSVVMDIMEKEHGAAVFLSDTIAHELMEPGGRNYMGIVEYFGEGILNEDKTINRKALGAIVFSDEAKLEKLNQLTHPNVIIETNLRIDKAMKDPAYKIVCLESALLFDAHLSDFCNQTWYVYANQDTRIERLIAGRGYERSYAESVMANQKNEDMYFEKADMIIDNSGTIEDTRAIIEAIMAE